MNAARTFVVAMTDHLPTVAEGATLRLIDLDGRAWDTLAELRDDLDIIVQPAQVQDWQQSSASVDAVIAYDAPPDPDLLGAALTVLRPGGRFILTLSAGYPDERYVRALQEAGFIHILVKAALSETETLRGVLMRGEKPPPVAERPAAPPAERARRAGRSVYLLIQQAPNKPTRRTKNLKPITWRALALVNGDEVIALAFSSLPKAVEFMQPSVALGLISDVNQISKFAWEVARAWPFPILLNPSDEILKTHSVTTLEVDPATAEPPDE